VKTVSVVIVNWNAAELLPACLESLNAQTGVQLLEVVVVDNASTDDSVDWLNEHASSFGFELVVVANQENEGFGRANNQGARFATGEVLVLLNPDTEVLGDHSLAALASALDEPSVGLVGPKLKNRDGSLQRSCAAFPGVVNSFVLASGIYKLLPESSRKTLAPGEWPQLETREIDWVGGACMAFRRSTYEEIGGFSEATFMYGEDMEISYDVQKLGLKTVFLAEAEITHYDDYSANKRWATPERAARVARGELTFLRRNYSRTRRLTIRAINLAGYSARWTVHAVRGDDRAGVFGAMARVYLRGK
jgi:GT2 family glycosyltransferase